MQAKRSFPIGPHITKCSMLVASGLHNSKSIESEWEIDFKLENTSTSMSYLTEVGREVMVTLGTFERDFFF